MYDLDSEMGLWWGNLLEKKINRQGRFWPCLIEIPRDLWPDNPGLGEKWPVGRIIADTSHFIPPD
jgi:hypothetical protein